MWSTLPPPTWLKIVAGRSVHHHLVTIYACRWSRFDVERSKSHRSSGHRSRCHFPIVYHLGMEMRKTPRSAFQGDEGSTDYRRYLYGLFVEHRLVLSGGLLILSPPSLFRSVSLSLRSKGVLTNHRDLIRTSWIQNIYSFVSVIIGLSLGLVVRYTRRLKWFVAAGTGIFILAFGILYKYRSTEHGGLTGLVAGEVSVFALDSEWSTESRCCSVSEVECSLIRPKHSFNLLSNTSD